MTIAEIVKMSVHERLQIMEVLWDSLISDIESLVIYAGVHSKEYGYYQMTSKRFPYSIYYSTNKYTAYVVAVLPERRSPAWVSNKLSK